MNPETNDRTGTDTSQLIPTRDDGTPRWSAMDLDDLVTWFETELRNELIGARDVDIDSDTDHPPYRWMNSHYPGFIKRLQREFDLSPGDFYREHIGIADGDEYDWGVDDDSTEQLLSQYVNELREQRGHPPTTWRPIRSRLAKYAMVYARVNGDSTLISGLRSEDQRPEEIQSAFDAFCVLDGVLGTPGSKLKYLSDVRRWYNWLIDTGYATYNPVQRFKRRLGLEDPEYDNPALDVDGVQRLAQVASDDRERILVVGLAGWGLRPSELASLRAGQLVINPGAKTDVSETTDDDHPYIEFGEGERKNGPGTVSMLSGQDLLTRRLDDLATDEAWNGYLFPSSQSKDGHISADTLRRWFATLVERANIRVRGNRPTPKYLRRFWYTLYGRAARAVAERYEIAADAQGSESAAVVIENYLSESARRTEIREEMKEELAGVFAEIDT